MARGKKKETLTPEERLQAALVPESEQPYPVPGNWCWTKVGVLSDLYRGVSYKKQDAHAERQEQDCLILRGGNVLEGAIETETGDNVYVSRNLVQEDQLLQPYDVIIVSSTGSSKVIGRAGISYTGYDNVAFGAFLTLVRPNDGIVKPFIAYYFQSDIYRNRIRELAAGVNINNIKANYITESPIPLPPFSEQQRIVDRIESLFAKLDEAKQKAQDTLDSFETRKAAILHKAFTGELTAQWRKEHGVRMESWDNTTLSKIVIGFKYGTSEKSDYSYKGMPVFRIPNITDDGLSFEDLKFLSHKDISDENQIHENDILIVRSNGSRELVGKSVLVPQLDREYAYASFLIRIQPLESVVPNYLVMYLNSTDARMQMFKKAKSSAGINNINSKELGAILINLPSFPEQTEIVRILDDLLAKEQQAKEAAEGVLEQIDLIKKSILARAFRGELGTNDPNEESAQELLKKSFIL